MRIAEAALFLSSSVFFNSIELISSGEVTLAQLFPGSNGIDLPPVEELRPEDTRRYHNFRTVDRHQMSTPCANFLRRGHVIFAFISGSNIKYAASLSNLFLERLENSFIVFDTSKDEWVTLSKPDYQKLGSTRNLFLIQARDAAVAMHKLYPNMMHPVNYEAMKKIHELASEAAYIAANREESKYRFKGIGQTSEGAALIQHAYSQTYRVAYDQAYMKYSG